MVSVKETPNGIILEIKVKPNSNQTCLYRKDDQLILEIQSPPENNQANMEIIHYLSKLFDKEARILKGMKSKKKVILIENSGKEAFDKSISVQQSHTA